MRTVSGAGRSSASQPSSRRCTSDRARPRAGAATPAAPSGQPIGRTGGSGRLGRRAHLPHWSPRWLLQVSGSKVPVPEPCRLPSRRCWPAPGSRWTPTSFVWWKALLALVVALALQVAVNYANDYSDGIRGTDADRVGPLRLVGSGAAPADAVKRAAIVSLRRRRRSRVSPWRPPRPGGCWRWAAWPWSRPGSTPAARRRTATARWARSACSSSSAWSPSSARRTCRSRASPRARGGPAPASARWPARSSSPTTCATSPATRRSASAPSPWCSATGDPGSCTAPCWSPPRGRSSASAATVTWWALLGLAAVPLALRALAVVRRGTTGPALIPVLRDTGLTELVYARRSAGRLHHLGRLTASGRAPGSGQRPSGWGPAVGSATVRLDAGRSTSTSSAARLAS